MAVSAESITYPQRVVASGLGFIEGPVCLPDGRIAVCNVAGRHVLSVDPRTGSVDPIATPGYGVNGMALGPDGALYLCGTPGFAVRSSSTGSNEPSGPAPERGTVGILRADLASGTVDVLYEEVCGRALVGPNDLVFDAEGGFYFTDFAGPVADSDAVRLGGLYYALPDGSAITELVHESELHVPLTQPNGVGLSPDGQRIAVSETVTGRLWEWSIESPGVLAPARVPMASNGAGLLYGAGGFDLFDSLAIEADGNICVATVSRGGITVVSPEGNLVEFVSIGEGDPLVTNICFAGPELRTAYVTTAGTGTLWEIDWPRPGLPLASQRSR
jgi:gluconolactonase